MHRPGCLLALAALLWWGPAADAQPPLVDGVLRLADLDASTGFAMYGPELVGYAGTAVSKAGDFNGDGYGDVLVGAWRGGPLSLIDLPERRQSGLTYVVLGGPDAAGMGTVQPSSQVGCDPASAESHR